MRIWSAGLLGRSEVESKIPTLSERAPALLPAVRFVYSGGIHRTPETGVPKTVDVTHEVDSEPAPFKNQPRKVRHPALFERHPPIANRSVRLEQARE
jgi:hypothetical protein